MHIDQSSSNKLPVLEYTLTCPWKRISFMLRGGAAVNSSHRKEAPCPTVVVFLVGGLVTMVTSMGS